MNRNLFRLVFSKKWGMRVAVAETATSQRKDGAGESGRRIGVGLLLFAGALNPLAGAMAQGALPTGGVVQAGQATIGSPSANALVVQQQSNRAIIDWQNFSIGTGNLVQFVQPGSGSVVLNRVVGDQMSSILGQLKANGGVFLTNPNGILFGGNAQVDVGHLVATTLGITNSNFMSGNVALAGTSNASVVNQGSILGNSVALVAAQVVNGGNISTPAGTAALAAGQAVDLDFNGDRLLVVRVNLGSEGGRIDHSGVISADGSGRVIMTAAAKDALLNTAINVTGRISAKGASLHGGEVFLDSGARGTTELVSGTIDVSSAQTQGGTVTLLGRHVGTLGRSSIQASGSDGGVVLIGGNYKGSGPERSSEAVYVSAESTVSADALLSGNGGKVILWSDSATQFLGSLTARGGRISGNGGLIETSSKGYLKSFGVVDASASNGNPGTWLLDPRNITISNDNTDGELTQDKPTYVAPKNGSFVNASDITNVLNSGTSGTNVSVSTGLSSNGGQEGNIDVNVGLSWTSSAKLTLIAAGDVDIKAPVGSTGGGKFVVQTSGGKIDSRAAAAINMGSEGTVSLQITGGHGGVTLRNSVTASSLTIVSPGAVGLDGLSLSSLEVTTGGAVTQGAAAVVTGATTVNAGTANITLTQAANEFGSIGATGGAVRITDKDALLLNAFNATSLEVTAGGAVTQGAAAVVTGATTVNAGTANITLTQAANEFGSIGATGGAVRITDKDALLLNAFNATSLEVTAGGAVTQGAAAVVTGATTVNAGTANITLTQAANEFGSIGATGGAVRITDKDALLLNAFNATSLEVTAGGAVTQGAAAVVTGATTVNAGTANITLTQAANEFGSIGATGGAVRITDKDALLLNAFNATSLEVTAGGAVTQSAAAVVTGATTVNAGTANITLTQAANEFGSIGATGGAVRITDKDALLLNAFNATSLEVTAGGAVTQSAAAVVTGATTVNAGTANITLTQAANEFGSIGATGGAVRITDKDALLLNAFNATSLEVTAGGAVTQSAAAKVTGATTVNAGSANITLTQATNELGGQLKVIGNLIQVTASTDLKITDLAVDAADLVSGGILTITGTDAVTSSGSLALKATGDIQLKTSLSTNQDLVVITGDSKVFTLDPGKTITVGSGKLGVNSSSVVADDGSIKIGLSGAYANRIPSGLILDSRFSSSPGNAIPSTFAGARNTPLLFVPTGNDLVNVTIDGSSSVEAKSSIPGSPLKVSESGFTAPGIEANASGSITLKGTVRSTDYLRLTADTGTISQQPASVLTVAGLSTITAAGAITLAESGNNFGGTVTATGSTVTLHDINALTASLTVIGAATLTAGGDIMATGSAGSLSATGNNVSSGVGAGSATLSAGGTGLNSGAVGSLSIVAAGAATNTGSVSGDASLTSTGKAAVSNTATVTGTLTTNGGDTSLAGALGALNVTAGGAVTQSGVLTVSGATNIAATGPGNSIALGTEGNNFGGDVKASGGDITLADGAGGIVLNDIGATGKLVVTSTGTGGGITQTQTPSTSVTVNGDTTLTAIGSAITLGNAGNNFGGTVTATGSTVTLHDINALTASLTVIGAATLTAGGDIMATGSAGSLSATGNNVSSGVGAGSATLSAGGTGLNSGAVGSLSIVAAGAATNTGSVSGDASLTSTGKAAVSNTATVTGTLTTNGGDTSLAGALGALNVTAGGAVTQSGVLTVSGATNIAATGPGNSIALGTEGNNFGGDVKASGGDITLADGAGGIVLNDIGATGKLVVTSTGTGGGITQTQTPSTSVTVNGDTTLTAIGSAITLGNAGNNFGGTVTATGSTVTLHDINALTASLTVIGAATLTAGGDIMATGSAGSLSATGNNVSSGVGAGSATLSAGGTGLNSGAVGSLSIVAAGAATNTGSVSGDASLTSTGKAAVSNTATVTGTLTTNGGDTSLAGALGALNVTAGGAVTQSGVLTVSGATNIAATGPGNSIALGTEGNNFGGDVKASGGDITLADGAGGIVLNDIGATGKLVVTSTGTGGGITQTQTPSTSVTVNGDTTLTAIGSAITLGNAGNNFAGSLKATGSNITLADGSGGLRLDSVVATGTLAVTATGPLSQAANTALQVGGAATFTAASSVDLSNTANVFDGSIGMTLTGGGTTTLASNKNIDLGMSNFGSAAVTLIAGEAKGKGQVFKVEAGAIEGSPEASTKASFTQSGALSSAPLGSLVLQSPTIANATAQADVLLNGVANDLSVSNDLKGTIATNSTATNPIDNFQVKSSEVNIGLGGLTARGVFLWTDKVTTPNGSAGGIRIVSRGVQADAATPPLVFKALTPGTSGQFGVATEAGWLYVDTDDHVSVIPSTDTSASAVVFLAGPTAYKPRYEFANDPTRRFVRYNGALPDSPQFLGALTSANAPLRESIKEQLSSGFSKENLRKQLTEGSVLQTGVARPGIDRIDNARAGEGCSVDASSLSCAAR